MEKITHYYVENPTVFDQLMKPVETLIKEQSEKLTSHHNEKFFFPDFFRLLIYYFVSGTQSIGLLINALKKNTLPPELKSSPLTGIDPHLLTGIDPLESCSDFDPPLFFPNAYRH